MTARHNNYKRRLKVLCLATLFVFAPLTIAGASLAIYLVIQGMPNSLSPEQIHAIEGTVCDHPYLFLGINGLIILLYWGMAASIASLRQRRSSKEILQESHERLEQTIRSTAVPLFVLDSNHTVIQWNTACEKLTGVKAHKILGTRNHWTAFYESQRPTLADFVLDGTSPDAIQKHYDHTVYPSRSLSRALECKGHLTKLGKHGKHLAFTAAPIYDVEGNIVGAVETIQDVTDFHEKDQRLKQSLSLCEMLIEKAPFALVLMDTQQRIRKINTAALNLIQRTEEEVLGKGCHQLICPNEKNKCPIRNFGLKINCAEKVILDRNGCHLPVIKSATPVMVGDEEWLLEMFIDATQIGRSRQQLRAENERLSTILQSLRESIVFADARDTIVEVNPSFLALCGRSRQELVGKNLLEMHSPSVQTKVRDLIQGFRETPNSESVCIRHEFFGRSASMRLQPVYALGRYIGTLMHLTDNTETEEALRAAEQSSKAKSEFLANMSHEIRTPMNSILGFCELLFNSPLNDEQSNYVDVILNSGRNLLQLINDILDFSKIEAGKLSIEKTQFSIQPLLRHLQQMMHPIAERKGLEFDITWNPDLPDLIETDSARLNQCLINLIGNAIKFTDTGYVHVHVTLEDNPEGPRLCFDIEDTGIGISKEKQQKIFESFSQADNSISRKYGGTGLGLSITQRLIHLMGGELLLQSQPGCGSIFTVIIPASTTDAPLQEEVDFSAPNQPQAEIIAVESDRIRPGDSAEEEQEPPLVPARILVAEDSAANQLLIRKMLEKYGFRVDVAADGKKAVQMAKDKYYDLIFLDMEMPVMDGYEAAGWIRKGGNTAILIALTANAMAGDREKCLEAGCDDYLSKPIQSEALKGILQQYIPELFKSGEELIHQLTERVQTIRREAEQISRLCEESDASDPARPATD